MGWGRAASTWQACTEVGALDSGRGVVVVVVVWMPVSMMKIPLSRGDDSG